MAFLQSMSVPRVLTFRQARHLYLAYQLAPLQSIHTHTTPRHRSHSHAAMHSNVMHQPADAGTRDDARGGCGGAGARERAGRAGCGAAGLFVGFDDPDCAVLGFGDLTECELAVG